MIFEYKAIQKDGHMTTGTQEAEDSHVLAKTLKEEGLVLISAHEKKKGPKGFSFSLKGFKMTERIAFARNLGSMLDAGLALSRALEVISRQTKKVKTKAIIDEINAKVKGGKLVQHGTGGLPEDLQLAFRIHGTSR